MKRKFNYISKKQKRINESGRVMMLLEMKHNITVEDKRKFRGVEWWDKSDSFDCLLDRAIFHYNSLKRYINNNR